MYPVEYTWMRKPTPVTTRIITAESGSSASAKGAANVPPPEAVAGNHSQRFATKRGSAIPASSRTAPAATRNESPTAPQAITPTAAFGRRRPISPQIRKPARGSSGTSGSAFSISPLQQIQLVHVGRLADAEEGDDHAESDRRLRGGDRDHEEDGDLAVGATVHPRKGHEREVARVQHQLDAHEDGDGAAAQEHRERADGEEHRAH